MRWGEKIDKIKKYREKIKKIWESRKDGKSARDKIFILKKETFFIDPWMSKWD